MITIKELNEFCLLFNRSAIIDYKTKRLKGFKGSDYVTKGYKINGEC